MTDGLKSGLPIAGYRPQSDDKIPYIPPSPALVEMGEWVEWARKQPGVTGAVEWTAPPVKIAWSAETERLTDWSQAAGVTDEYREIRTPVPPVIALEDGRLVIKVIAGNLTLVAPLGDGAWFFQQLVEKLVQPALRAYSAAVRDPGAPND